MAHNNIIHLSPSTQPGRIVVGGGLDWMDGWAGRPEDNIIPSRIMQIRCVKKAISALNAKEEENMTMLTKQQHFMTRHTNTAIECRNDNNNNGTYNIYLSWTNERTISIHPRTLFDWAKF